MGAAFELRREVSEFIYTWTTPSSQGVGSTSGRGATLGLLRGLSSAAINMVLLRGSLSVS